MHIDLILYLSAQETERETSKIQKKFERIWKKFLTNDESLDIINKLNRESEKLQAVPCKLNNAKTNKINTLDN